MDYNTEKPKSPSPHDYDRGAAEHVEKKPERERGGENSPQQTHDTEDQG